MLLRLLSALAAGLLLSCSAFADSRVLTTIKPVQLISAALLNGIDEPAVLLPPGASPHSFALRPSDRRALADAERIYWVGPNLERFLEDVLHDAANARELMDVPGLTLREYAEEHAEHGHDHHDHHHDEGSLDPHIWLSLDNALVLARWMKQDLAPLYPEQQAQLDANLAHFEQQVGELEQALQAGQRSPYRWLTEQHVLTVRVEENDPRLLNANTRSQWHTHFKRHSPQQRR